MRKINVFWFRRDLRLNDNTGLNKALKSTLPVLPVFILDKDILENLPHEDKRVAFIFFHLESIKSKLESIGSSLLILNDKPIQAFEKLPSQYTINEVFANHDYEPYAIRRDDQIKTFLNSKGIAFSTYKDQVIFEKQEVIKNDGTPYTVFTPYSRKWKENFQLKKNDLFVSVQTTVSPENFLKTRPFRMPGLEETGFKRTSYIPELPSIDVDIISDYHKNRDIPGIQGTSRLGPHLRFGTISIRELATIAEKVNEVFLNELIWREFFMSILYHYPRVEQHSFKKQYDSIEWRNNLEEFERWCRGETGFPMVDAGMRELNATGFMHNRIRMITAGFLTKDLLVDWRWGEAYFAEKLLDYELSSNNGNWQWAAGTGCDAAPYFRIFNPAEQARKFDPDWVYIKKWIPEIHTVSYPKPMIDHGFARKRALETYKKASLI
ncbi:MAG: deoxyribodipyrimidine photo-lyase [Bacteroidales bacterium]